MPRAFPQRIGEHALGVPGPSMPDARDWLYPLPPRAPGAPGAPRRDFIWPGRPRSDQGPQGSCVPSSISRAFEVDTLLTEEADTDVSRAYLYKEARRLQGWELEDTGSFARDVIHVLRTLGVPSENRFPYVPSDFTREPSKAAHREARRNRAAEFRSCPTPDHVLAALDRSDVVVLCFTVYESFEESGETGIWTPPRGKILGGHCVTAEGYDLDHPAGPSALCANSWGRSWGIEHPLNQEDEAYAEFFGGYFWLPFDVFTTAAVWDVFSIHRSALVVG